MLVLAGTAAYIGSMTLICLPPPLVNFLQQPITIQHSLMLIGFSARWVELRVQIKGESPAGTLHVQLWGEN